MPMTPCERWHAVLDRRTPDRVPMDYWGTPEIMRKLQQHLGCDSDWAVWRKLRIDKMYHVRPRYVGPTLRPQHDIYGCRWTQVPHEGGVYDECVGHPLAAHDTIDEVERHYTWPTADWFDYRDLAEQTRGREEYPICGGGSEPFLTYCELRGMERAYRDLVSRPELVHHCLGRLYDFSYENTRRILEALPGRVTACYIAEDMGSQEGLLFSPQTIRTFFLPHMQRMIGLAHSAGARAMTHSDGAIRKIIPDLIAIGVDILNPIQWRCAGMERKALKREFGAQLVFHGGVDNQQTLAFGTAADVEREVAENLETLGAGGGYILAPCHNIQGISPVENVVALYEAGLRYGRV